ncbi:hypothetical protein SUDANB105_01807 [Streptomyces sp. enrichment culture]|uniref:hypothetical protein n=1 Tax=Streptomyces sp. enrichment culture TaxID=1795815 RepID=UPI003F56693B
MIALVEISGGHGSSATKVAIRYRSYIPWADPWDRISPEPASFPAAGTWAFGRQAPPGWDLDLQTDAEGKVATLFSFDKFDRLKVGLRGQGGFYAAGYRIPAHTIFEWHVLELS